MVQPPPSSHERRRRSCASDSPSSAIGALITVALLGLAPRPTRAWTQHAPFASASRHRRALLASHGSHVPLSSVEVDRQPSSPSIDAIDTSTQPPIVLAAGSNADEELRRLLRAEDQTPVALEGYVGKRRAIGKSLAFLDIHVVDDAESVVGLDQDPALPPPVQALFRREFWADEDGDDNSFDAYHKVLQPGVRVRLQGRAGPSRNPGEAMMFVSAAKYVGPNANPQHLRNVLRYARDGELGAEEVAEALDLKADDLVAMLRKTTVGGDGSSAETSCGELAREILTSFPRGSLLDPSRIMGQNGAKKKAILPPVPPQFANPPESARDYGYLESAQGDPLSVAAVLDAPVHKEGTKEVTVSAWVQNRRRYGDYVTVLEVVDDFSAVSSLQGSDSTDGDTTGAEDMKARNEQVRALWKGRLYCVLHPGTTKSLSLPDWSSGDAADTAEDKAGQNSTALNPAGMYGNILSTGARALLRGYVAADDRAPTGGVDSDGDTAILWVTGARLQRSSWRPSVVRTVLDLIHSGDMDVEEAATALDLPGGYSQAEDIAAGGTDLTERQWMAAELSRTLQGENSRIGGVTKEMLRVLDSYAGARELFPMVEGALASNDKANAEEEASVASIPDPVSAGDPLRTSSSGSRWQRAKRPQLEWMIRQIEEVVQSHPDYGSRPLRVVDVGGGKGHLANLVAEHFGEDIVDVHVVDISRSAIKNGMMRARRRSLDNIRYEANDATAADVSGADVVVALHACGALSDVALGHATAEGAAFVVCPCCYRSNPQLRVRIPAYVNGDEEGSARSCERLGTVADWLDTNSDDLEVLQRAAEIQGDTGTSASAMHSICSLRAAAAARRRKSVSVEIRTFPIGFSTRNLCIIGKMS